jgi:hypothetical protein
MAKVCYFPDCRNSPLRRCDNCRAQFCADHFEADSHLVLCLLCRPKPKYAPLDAVKKVCILNRGTSAYSSPGIRAAKIGFFGGGLEVDLIEEAEDFLYVNSYGAKGYIPRSCAGPVVVKAARVTEPDSSRQRTQSPPSSEDRSIALAGENEPRRKRWWRRGSSRLRWPPTSAASDQHYVNQQVPQASLAGTNAAEAPQVRTATEHHHVESQKGDEAREIKESTWHAVSPPPAGTTGPSALDKATASQSKGKVMKSSLPKYIAAYGFIAAALLAVFAVILPWFVPPFGSSRSGADTLDGKLVLVFAVLLAGLGGGNLLLPRRPVAKWTTLVAGAVIGVLLVVIAIYDIVNNQRLFQASGGTVRVGSGLYVTALAGVAASLAAFAGLFEDTSPLAGPAPILATPLGHGVRTPVRRDNEHGQRFVRREDDDPVGPAIPRDTVPERLRELARLHNEGILTDNEYEHKRRELVEQL